jgi:protein-tyrosine phosphatase
LRADYVVAMDRGNLRALQALCPTAGPRLHLLMDFAAEAAVREVPDPYGGTEAAFERVLDLVEAGARGLLGHIVRTDLGSPAPAAPPYPVRR